MRQRGPLVALVAGVVIVALLVVGLLLPKLSAVTEARNKLETAKQTEVSLRVQLEQLQEARKQAAKVQKELEKLEALVPPTVDQQGIINLLKRAADRSAVDFMSLTPGAPSTTPSGVSVVGLQISAAGSFFAVDEFLFRLETLPRALKITQLTVGPAGEGANQLSLTLGAEVYTTDASAGPGSEPGPTEPTVAPTAAPTAAPTTGG